MYIVFIYAYSSIEAHESWQGDTPLIMATRKGFEDIVKLLLDGGADISMKNKVGTWMDFNKKIRCTDKILICNIILLILGWEDCSYYRGGKA